jgi:hypothetical protein
VAGPFACKLCGAPGAIAMPGDIAVRSVRCAACEREQLVNQYASGAQQIFEEVARIQAAKAERDEKLQRGVVCSGCGGTMALPADPSIDAFSCRFCGKQHLVSEFLDAKLLANQRLRADLRARVDQAQAEGAARDKRIVVLVFGLLLLFGAVIAIVLFAGRR